MSTDAKTGFWTPLSGGRVRFQWNEPWAFRRLKLNAELKRLRPGFVWAVAVGFPVLVFFACLFANHLSGDRMRWDVALMAAICLPGGLVLALWLQVRLLAAVTVRDEWLIYSGGRAHRRWRNIESFELAAGEQFAVLALMTRERRQLTLIGVPSTVPLADLDAFLESRGVRRLAGEIRLPVQLPQAAG